MSLARAARQRYAQFVSAHDQRAPPSDRMNPRWIFGIDALAGQASPTFRFLTPAIFALLALTSELRRKQVRRTVTVAKNNRV